MENSNLYVDVHHHYRPDSAREIRQTLEMMEEHGIRKSILSCPDESPSQSDKERAAVCLKINECFAKLTVKHPRLGAFALIPMTLSHDFAQLEIERALDILHLDGILLPTCVSGIYPSSNLYHHIYKEVNRRNGTVFFHPFDLNERKTKGEDVTYLMMSEVTRATCELVLNKIIHQYPNIRFIMPYGGGNTSFLFQTDRRQVLHSILSDSFSKEDALHGIKYCLRSLYYDMAFPSRMNFMASLGTFAERTKLLYGSDFPSFSADTIRQNLADLEQHEYEDGKTMADYCKANSLYF